MRYGRFISVTDKKERTRTRTLRVMMGIESSISQAFPELRGDSGDRLTIVDAILFIAYHTLPGECNPYDVLMALWPEHKKLIDQQMRIELENKLLDAAGHKEPADERDLPF